MSEYLAQSTTVEQQAAEVERLRALVGRQHKALQPLYDSGWRDQLPSIAKLDAAEAVLADPDGQRAAEEWAALADVAEQASLDAFHAAEQCKARKAEVDRLRALVARQHEALELWAAIPNPERTHVRCAYCAVSVPAERLLQHTPDCVLADGDGQRAAEVWDALVEVAETAQAWEDVRKAYVFGAQEVMEAEAWLCVALDHLRAVQDGKEEKDGHGPGEGD